MYELRIDRTVDMTNKAPLHGCFVYILKCLHKYYK